MKAFFEKHFARLVALNCVAAFFVFITSGYTIGHDSGSYVENAVFRPPAYPFLLTMLRHVLGDHALMAVTFIQIAVILGAALFFARSLRRAFALPAWAAYLVHLAALLPLLPSGPFYLTVPLANFILSEPPAYAIFLLCGGLFARLCSEPDCRPCWLWLAALCVLNTLFRPQMVFVYPVFLLFLLWRGRSVLWTALMLLVLAQGSAAVMERAYNRVVNGRFAGASMLYPHVMMNLMYLSGPQHAALIADPSDRALFERMRASAGRSASLARCRPAGYPLYRHYAENSNQLFWGAIVAEYKAARGDQKLSIDRDADMFISLNSFSRRVSIALAPALWREYASTVAVRFLASPSLVEWALVLLALGLCLRLARSPAGTFAILSVMLALSNHFVVEALSKFQQRYMIYTYVLLAAAVVAACASLPGIIIAPSHKGKKV